MNEREFIAQVESADVETFARLLSHPTREEEETLRVYFGHQRFSRMRGLAMTRSRQTRGPASATVVVLHGIMGGELTRVPPGKAGIHFWLNLRRMIFGEFSNCRMNDDGRGEPHDIRATGILKRYYGEQLLSLAQHFQVRPFWYDWRRDLRQSAAALEAFLRNIDQPEQTIHFVAHSMGGLVVRTFMTMYAQHWEQLRDRGSRVVQLGTPNFGSFAISQVLTGTEPTLRRIAMLDLRHSLNDIRAIAGTFPGCYQMLPSPEALPQAEVLYQSSNWHAFSHVSARHLADALAFQAMIDSTAFDPAIQYIAGCNRETLSDLRSEDGQTFPLFNAELAQPAQVKQVYRSTIHGDGTVPHSLGFLRNGQQVIRDVFFVEEEHGSLPVNRQVLQALPELLNSGTTNVLPRTIPQRRGTSSARAVDQDDAQAQKIADRILVRTGGGRDRRFGRSTLRDASVAPEADVDRTPLSADEREYERLTLRSFLYDAADEAEPYHQRDRPRVPELSVRIRLVEGGIEKTEEYDTAELPVDCLSVGHYVGSTPQTAVKQLDLALSEGRAGSQASAEASDKGIISQFVERGIVVGHLGQPFFIPDLRDPRGQRLVVLAGMGLPGRFGVPELTVMVRELIWSLRRLGKRHLATVLIGSGRGNLSTEDAIMGWMAGIEQAMLGSESQAAKPDGDSARQETRGSLPYEMQITFVEFDSTRLPILHHALRRACESRSWIVSELPSTDMVNQWIDFAGAAAALRTQRALREQQAEEPTTQVPTRLTVEMTGSAYKFGAITETASIPERVINIDPRLVMQANDAIVKAETPAEQYQEGRFLERLLIPDDLRTQLATPAPLVLIVDRTTASIHWESMSSPTLLQQDSPAEKPKFMGIDRGLTRQFRTVVAPPPEPPPPPRRVLRVLVVADPAPDASLPGAELEGMEVADLFEKFNRGTADAMGNRVEVVRLIGPYEARRDAVLKRLLLERWDVLHFAGHCYYNRGEPSQSGWIFHQGAQEILSADELNRIDRVPSFVFSNACESGVTPDRAEKRDATLAPSFAETFFKRGVTNFVCTAWPVDDEAARQFALSLYEQLLGMKPMHTAMQHAREQVFKSGGLRTWGAYQHYGNPNFRFFAERKGTS